MAERKRKVERKAEMTIYAILTFHARPGETSAEGRKNIDSILYNLNDEFVVCEGLNDVIKFAVEEMMSFEQDPFTLKKRTHRIVTDRHKIDMSWKRK